MKNNEDNLKVNGEQKFKNVTNNFIFVQNGSEKTKGIFFETANKRHEEVQVSNAASSEITMKAPNMTSQPEKVQENVIALNQEKAEVQKNMKDQIQHHI